MKIEDINNTDGYLVLDFYAEWCGPCKMFTPIFEKAKSSFTNIKFDKINVDDNKELAKKLGIMSIPTVVLFKDGKEIKRNIGFISEDNFISFLKPID